MYNPHNINFQQPFIAWCPIYFQPQNIDYFYPNNDTYLYEQMPAQIKHQQEEQVILQEHIQNENEGALQIQTVALEVKPSMPLKKQELRFHKKRQFKKFSIYKYPKKNAESNTINQIFSYMCLKIKSQQILKKLFKYDALKVDRFYQFVNLLKKQNKKYINRGYLVDLAKFKADHPGHRIIMESMSPDTLSALPIKDIRKAVRVLVVYYLQTKCMLSIVTSRKLQRQTIQQHISRRRQILQDFKQAMSKKQQQSQVQFMVKLEFNQN